VYPTERVREKILVPYLIEFVSGVLRRHWCPTQDSGTLPAIEFVRGVYGIELMVCRLQCDIQNFAGNHVGTLPAIEFVRDVYRLEVCYVDYSVIASWETTFVLYP